MPTQQWAQFEQNAAVLSEADRKRMQEEGEALYSELAGAKRAGVAPGGETANRLAEQHRAMVSQLFDANARHHGVDPGQATWE